MKRNEAISTAKAIAILLVVIGHAGVGIGYVSNVIQAFHMPLFYILSGMCFKEKYLADAKTFVKRKVTGIWWPYIKWGVIFLLLHNVCYHLHIYDANYGYLGEGSSLYTRSDYLYLLKEMVIRMRGHEQLLGTFWFMKPLFYGSLLFYMTLRICRNNKWWTCGILLFITMITKIFHLSFPIVKCSWLVSYAAIFIAIGYILQNNDIADYLQTKQKRIMYVCVCVAILLIGAALNPNAGGMTTQSDYTLIPYIVPAIAGSMLMISFGKWLDRRIDEGRSKSIILFIGDHTLEIMALQFLAFKVVSLIIILIHGLPIEQLAEFPVVEQYSPSGWWIAYIITGMVLPTIYAYCKWRILRKKEIE